VSDILGDLEDPEFVQAVLGLRAPTRIVQVPQDRERELFQLIIGVI
jgi:hypothetical protein